MLVVPDINNLFLPLSQSKLFVKYSECTGIIDNLLDKLPLMFGQSKVNECAGGAALEAAAVALEGTAGKCLYFVSSLCTVGPGKLNKRDQPTIIGTDKEKSLYQSQDPFYQNIAEKCVKNSTCIDLFLFPFAFMDVATLAIVSKLTGGQIYFYPHFNIKHAHKLMVELQRNVQRNFGMQALMRVRCSRGILFNDKLTKSGLTVSNQFGNFFLKGSNEMELAGIDCDKSFCIEIKYDDKLDEKSEPCFQCALLYTTKAGERRIRVNTLSLTCTSVLGNLFKAADCDTILNFFARTGKYI